MKAYKPFQCSAEFVVACGKVMNGGQVYAPFINHFLQLPIVPLPGSIIVGPIPSRRSRRRRWRSFLSPVAHPADMLVIRLGGYRFSNHCKQGLLIIVIIFSVLLPVLFPFYNMRP